MREPESFANSVDIIAPGLPVDRMDYFRRASSEILHQQIRERELDPRVTHRTGFAFSKIAPVAVEFIGDRDEIVDAFRLASVAGINHRSNLDSITGHGGFYSSGLIKDAHMGGRHRTVIKGEMVLTDFWRKPGASRLWMAMGCQHVFRPSDIDIVRDEYKAIPADERMGIRDLGNEFSVSVDHYLRTGQIVNFFAAGTRNPYGREIQQFQGGLGKMVAEIATEQTPIMYVPIYIDYLDTPARAGTWASDIQSPSLIDRNIRHKVGLLTERVMLIGEPIEFTGGKKRKEITQIAQDAVADLGEQSPFANVIPMYQPGFVKETPDRRKAA